jgi:hypothetical protein
MASTERLTIGDLMGLGFDPTRLKEIVLDNENFIFERIIARQLSELKKKESSRLKLAMPHARPVTPN